ncbi:ABC transporter substrate-binding protein, partial [Candidatus Bathyarchaeota archaeon]|nr:ABC transporter substrate-binding protein [Candidatus Bathyarchaeota archaeon]
SSDLLVEPVNPVGGSNWIYDAMYFRAVSDPAIIPDPFTGLYWPQRVKRAEVYALAGSPIGATLDWVSLKFVENITVPTDAWYDWDAEKHEVLLAPPGTTAKTKTVVYYNDNLFDVKYHDGSRFSLADMIFSYILTFDRGKPESSVYDESYLPTFEAFREYFKGFKIVSEKPLVIEYYSDAIYLDAEWIAATAAGAFYTDYTYGPGPWHTVAVGWLAEADKRLAYSADKAEKLEVEWASYIAGPSLPILEEYLAKAISEKFIPYKSVMSRYITESEALDRYNKLREWYKAKGNFLVGAGPFYLERVDPTARIVVLKAYREFIDPADRWLRFSRPMIPEVKIVSIPTITPGMQADINISITFEGNPYKKDDINYVKYIVTSPTVTLVGVAEAVEDGRWKITLKREETSMLSAGALGIDVLVISKLVGMPVSTSGTATVMSVTEFLMDELAKARAEYEIRVSELSSTIKDLRASIEGLRSRVDSLSGTVNTLMSVAALAIIIAIAAIAVPFIKKK